MNAEVGFMGLAIAPLSMPFEMVSSVIFNAGGFLISFVELQEKKVKRLKKKRRRGDGEKERMGEKKDFLGVVKTD
jgi:hypothetical protein